MKIRIISKSFSLDVTNKIISREIIVIDVTIAMYTYVHC